MRDQMVERRRQSVGSGLSPPPSKNLFVEIEEENATDR
jgi:hypothetical protein